MDHSIRRIETRTDRTLAKEFVDAHHSYIQWRDRPGRKLHWLLFEEGRLVGVWSVGSVFDRPKAVKAFMAEHAMLPGEVGNNIVYCLAGQTDRNAGSRFLRLCREDACRWWPRRYGQALKAFQTFILPPRTGAVYRADNWAVLGYTRGATVVARNITPQEQTALTEAGKSFSVWAASDGRVITSVREWTTTAPKLILMRKAVAKAHGHNGKVEVYSGAEGISGWMTASRRS